MYDTQFKRFARYNSGRLFALTAGDFVAIVTLSPSSWAWTVWYEGRPVAGRMSSRMDLLGACNEACEVIERLKTEAATPAT